MKRFIILYMIAGLALAGCQTPAEPVERMATIEQVSDSTWTYFSFETGAVVGVGKLLSEEDDAHWKNRTDWDIAICGDLIRTNSGTSGTGQGGIISIPDKDYFSLTEAPLDGYITDTDNVVVVK